MIRVMVMRRVAGNGLSPSGGFGGPSVPPRQSLWFPGFPFRESAKVGDRELRLRERAEGAKLRLDAGPFDGELYLAVRLSESSRGLH